MCLGSPKPPKLPPKPRTPTPAESGVKAEEIRRRRLAGAVNRASNYEGVSDFGQNARKHRLTLGV